MQIILLEEILWLIFKSCFAVILILLFLDLIRYWKSMPIFWRKEEVRESAGVEDISLQQTLEGPVAEEKKGEQETRDKKEGERPGLQFTPEEIITNRNEMRERREKDKKRIGHILLEHNLITKEVLAQAVEHQRQYGGNITQYLLHYGYIDEKQLAHCLCTQFKVPYLPLEAYDISDEIIRLVPTDIAEKYWVLPVEKHGHTLTVVMIDPLDTHVIKELENMTGLTIVPFIGIISEIVKGLQVYYKLFMGNDGAKKPPFLIDTQTYVGKERRNSIRYAAQLDIQFPVQGFYVKSQTIDVSRDGFAFRSDRSLNLGEFLPLIINLPREVSAFPIAAITQVVRCIVKTENVFEIAVKTIKISKEEIGTIINYAAAKKTNSDS